ncbi:acylneuraminate cytidylyltransferase family protein [Clostridium sp. D2Q-14]|uniref:acylneuraminate cytidylyltransferase family protein n=1 Tax=Anaeromonas gelatinilytica TaxID=2683194 RepID=UPI00193BF77F|nr:acylneuraminate cytidylyltransferase family protein [Anaeromonas gelatinilytica]MBS4534377.1 acylneuraminate cytidylyltransferase family protein [Anaeromonas gelatinilytica]
MDNILCIIPARGGSKGLPGKNIKTLIDKPLIAWTIDASLKSKYINKVIVSTDDREIADISMKYGATIIQRPAQFATDTSSTMDVIIHTLTYLENKENYKPDYVALLQCTSPLRNENHIDEAIEKILNNKIEVESLISVTKEEHPPWWLRTINTDGYIERYFEYDVMKSTRRQDFTDLYRPNGAIYIAKTEVLLDTKSFQTSKTVPYIMDYRSSIDIDTEIDFILAETIIKSI